MTYKLIIQARTNSSRLPGKMLKPFFNDKTILEIIIDNLKESFSEQDIILATTINPDDDHLVNAARIKGIEIFRGDENDVLQRFIKAAETNDAHTIVRICADNPFLQVDSIQHLLLKFQEESVDYLSYELYDHTPVIKSHLGLFAEVTTLKALKKVAQLTNEKKYREHVTNYIYAHPEFFKIKLLPLDQTLIFRNKIRLTIDTLDDFQLCQEIYDEISPNFTVESLLNAIDLKPSIVERMKAQIIENSK